MAKKKDLTIKVIADQIMHTGISVSRDGYKNARMLIKVGEKEYMSIGYEWEGDQVPGFVMDIMSFIKAHKEEISQSEEEHAEEFATYNERHKK